MTDLVVDLGDTRSGTVRDALAQALGDPTLAVGYRIDGRYVDAAGRPTTLPPPGSDRKVTRIERDGDEVAVIVHQTRPRVVVLPHHHRNVDFVAQMRAVLQLSGRPHMSFSS